MATTQTTVNNAVEVKEFYDKTLLTRMNPKLVFAKYAQLKPLPKGNGKTISFRRFESLSPATAPLTEGVTPSGSGLSITEIKATIKQYGDFIETSDLLVDTAIDPITTETAELLGEQAGETLDEVTRDVIIVGTNVIYSGGKTSTNTITASDKMTSSLVKNAVKILKNNNAKPVEGGYYVGFINPDVAADLMEDSLWQDVSKYNGGTAIKDGEIGKLHGVRFIETTKIKEVENSSGVTVHKCLIIGKDAYGAVDLGKRKGHKMIIKKPGSAGSADPLNQRGTAGWKAAYEAVRLNELAMIRVECAASV